MKNTNKGIAKKKIAFVSLGCAKNLVNTEQMMYMLSGAGYEVTGETDGANAVVINTCSFIESAKMEAIETILEFAGIKEKGGLERIIVTGCLPERYKEEILRELPEIDAVLGTGSFDRIVEAVEGKPESCGKPAFFDDINAPASEGGRIITSSNVWAYLKIAEGCDNRCAYCVIPDIRGRYRSREPGNIIREAESLVRRGIKELIIVAQDVTRYGLDLYGRRELAQLLGRLEELEGLKWVRLHYLYPDMIDDGLIDVIAKSGKITKYLDIPIQHVNDAILRNMRRRGTGDSIRELFGRLRERIPGLALRTSIITGLPGEGEKEFEELYGFLKETKIERAGIFAYSPEEGTPAASMEHPDRETAERRAGQLRDVQAQVMGAYNEGRIGSLETVLIEGINENGYYGRSYAESPEIDGYIKVKGRRAAVDEFADVRITAVEGAEPVGHFV